MSWRLEIRHETEYRYDRPVVASYNEARVTPLNTGRQRVSRSEVFVEPAAELFSYYDYWGTLVHAFDVHDPHQRLVVTSVSTVATAEPDEAPEAGAPDEDGEGAEAPQAEWADLDGDDFSNRYYEFLAPSRLVSTNEFSVLAADLRQGCVSPAHAARRVKAWAHRELQYGAGTTHVGTSALEAWQAGRGVCQDFAHLTLAVLRAMGVPARYVSGYFYPKSSGALGTEVLGESHAWVEAWTGSWVAHDPTNDVPVRERHVVVARGRDYSDVPPLRGIYSGPPGSTTGVTVRIVRRA
ncbi:MAG TPA: transglutaminase family protein [Acidimicrobiales bacterium]|nr:transglutaminase family protein [Acidimicrobiales bacterium]